MNKLSQKSPTRWTYRGYSIEQFGDDGYAVYSLTNSMYDCHHGFKTVQEATKFIDDRVA